MYGRVANGFVLCFAMLLVVFASAPARCANTVTLNYSIFFPATHAHTIAATEWGAEIEKRTKGAVKVNMFPGGTLTPPDQCYDGVVKGISDIGMSVVSYTMGRFPLTEVLDLPLGYTSGVQASRLSNAYYERFKPREFGDVKMMYMHAYGPGIVHTGKTPVKSLEDLKGLKVRCSGTSAKVVSALGATPVAMPQTEVYDALQKGIVGGVVCPIEALKGFKLVEVSKYTTLNYGSSYSLSFFVAMNRKKWDSLPKDVQDIIEKINQEWIDKTGQTWDRIDKEAKEYGLDKGHEFIPLSKEEDARWAQAVKSIFAQYTASTKTKNLPGEDAFNFCVDWLKKNPWQKPVQRFLFNRGTASPLSNHKALFRQPFESIRKLGRVADSPSIRYRRKTACYWKDAYRSGKKTPNCTFPGDGGQDIRTAIFWTRQRTYIRKEWRWFMVRPA